jgi:hypothetical protein
MPVVLLVLTTVRTWLWILCCAAFKKKRKKRDLLVVVCGLIRKNGWSCLASSAGLALPFWKAQARALSISLWRSAPVVFASTTTCILHADLTSPLLLCSTNWFAVVVVVPGREIVIKMLEL